MSRDEMEHGFAQGRSLTQEEWAHPDEISWVDNFIAEGRAEVVSDWCYKDGFQCERRIVRGVPTP
mgnify:FL=1